MIAFIRKARSRYTRAASRFNKEGYNVQSNDSDSHVHAPVNTNTLAEILVSYRQGNVKLDKHYENGTLPGGMSLDGARVIIKLTQDEANMFKGDNKASVQVRVLTASGDALASQRFGITVLGNDAHAKEPRLNNARTYDVLR